MLLLHLAAGCTPRQSVRPPDAPFSGPLVYLVSHGWHVGMAMERQEVSQTIWPESGDFSGYRYLEVGWGDADYYPAVRGTLGLALKAAFSSKGSVLHVVAFDASLSEFFPGAEIIEIPLTRRGFDELSRFIHASYARDVSGRPLVVGPGLYGHGVFYQATGQYRLHRNSNNWTARALSIAGCPVDAASAVSADRVMDEGRRFGRVVGSGVSSGADATGRETCR